MLVNQITIAALAICQNPEASKPGTSQAVSQTMPMLIRNSPMPSVTMMNGMPSTTSTGLMKVLTIANTRPARASAP